ncbi:tetraspanin, putative [Schistosoma mansoni]|uniref:tetraspanin, putative n=1 Tax=Schistosoma mansoni TaxID=6183 RepID=UPI00022C81C4|nr:tetraspanin, putative [Schistosoma mansoni]|eukprot:XP_018647127.1 tetraspanin, putative [Schistosoma mansoni]
MHSTVRRIFHVLNLICLLVLLLAFVFFVIAFWTKLPVKIVEPTLKKLRIDGINNRTVSDGVNSVLRTFTRPIILPLMAISLVFACIYLFGALIAFNRSSTLFLMYEVTLTVCIIVHIVMITMVLKHPENVKKMMEKLFSRKFYLYRSMSSLDGASLFAAVVMIDLKCCGYLNPFDFDDDKTESNDEYDGHTYDDLLLPIPCCMMDKHFRLIDINCPNFHYMSENEQKHHNKGCKQLFGQKAFSIIAYIAYLSITLIVINIALVICVILVLKEIWIYL